MGGWKRKYKNGNGHCYDNGGDWDANGMDEKTGVAMGGNECQMEIGSIQTRKRWVQSKSQKQGADDAERTE